MKKQKMKLFEELGLRGCLNDSGITSQNYKRRIGMDDMNDDKMTEVWNKIEDVLLGSDSNYLESIFYLSRMHALIFSHLSYKFGDDSSTCKSAEELFKKSAKDIKDVIVASIKKGEKE